MGSVPLFMNRIIHISTSSSFTNVIKCVLLCSRTNVWVTSQSLIFRGLTECDTSANDDDFYDFNYLHARGREFNRKATVSMLQNLLSCSVKEIESMVRKCPELKFVSAKNMQCNIQFFKAKGVSEEILHKNPWLLKYKAGSLSYKLDILKKMNLDDVTAVIPLLQLSIPKLKDLAALAEKESFEVPHGNRIKYISEKLQCSLEDVCKEFEEHEFLFNVPFDRFTTILSLLLGAGVSPQYILRDMWVFRYNVSNIAQRLEMAKEVGIRTIKPWMLRCSPKVFSKKLRREAARKKLLGESSVVEYLSQQLQCDTETVEYISSKNPSILRVHVPKLKEILDFLYREGFTPQHVCQVPRILCHSLETTKSRLAELREIGYNPSTLIVLCRSKRQYAQFLEQVKRRRNR